MKNKEVLKLQRHQEEAEKKLDIAGGLFSFLDRESFKESTPALEKVYKRLLEAEPLGHRSWDLIACETRPRRWAFGTLKLIGMITTAGNWKWGWLSEIDGVPSISKLMFTSRRKRSLANKSVVLDENERAKVINAAIRIFGFELIDFVKLPSFEKSSFVLGFKNIEVVSLDEESDDFVKNKITEFRLAAETDLRKA